MAADLERRQQAEHFTILDLAQVPERPFKPKRQLMILAVLVGALALSLGLAYLQDMLNGTLKMERELKALLPANVPLLAAVPRLQDSADRRSAIRFAVVAVVITVIGFALEAELYFRLHPNL
jgi:capsular polysaccharide biosynthesis protein